MDSVPSNGFMKASAAIVADAPARAKRKKSNTNGMAQMGRLQVAIH